ncbi:cell division protein FtsQ/DivIB [Sphingomonas lacunae]|nr:cell division protein FtsQ/DivIB [Sphingomonas lacunae]
MTRGGGKAKQTVKRGKAAKPRSAPRRTGPRRPSLLARGLAAQPFSPAVLRRVAVTVFVGVALIILYQIASMTGVNAYLRAEAVDAVGRAGFAVKKVEVFGANRIDRVRVYDIALEQRDRSMLAFDLEEVRQDLLRYGWVADARVSRRLPDTLVIDLVERTPVAIWQDRGRYTLIDSKGVILPGVDPASVTGLPVLAGQGANERMADLDRLLDAAPALRPQLAGASWIGNRRWDLRFKTGEVLALPEDAKRAADAYAEFARLDGVNRLLGRGIRRFDMRIAGRFVLRPGRDGDLGDLNLISASDRTTRVEQPRTDNENGG